MSAINITFLERPTILPSCSTSNNHWAKKKRKTKITVVPHLLIVCSSQRQFTRITTVPSPPRRRRPLTTTPTRHHHPLDPTRGSPHVIALVRPPLVSRSISLRLNHFLPISLRHSSKGPRLLVFRSLPALPSRGGKGGGGGSRVGGRFSGGSSCAGGVFHLPSIFVFLSFSLSFFLSLLFSFLHNTSLSFSVSYCYFVVFNPQKTSLRNTYTHHYLRILE